MPLVAGAVLPLVGYEGIFLGAAALILVSIPFVFAMEGNRTRHPGPADGSPIRPQEGS